MFTLRDTATTLSSRNIPLDGDVAGVLPRLRHVVGDAKGWLKGSYLGMYGKFDREMIPSGLVRPVRLVVEGSRDAVKKPGRPVRAAGSEGPPGLAAAQTDWFHRQ